MATTQPTIHPFQAAGLGNAPFRYVGVEHQEIAYGERVIGSAGGVPITTKPGGTCAYCRKYIVNLFVVESMDGNRFHVGCDCIRKVNVIGTKAMDKDVKEMKKSREAARIAEAKANLPHAHGLRSQPHPNAFHAANGKTLADYVAWLFKNSGTSGMLRAARMVELAMASVVDE